MGSHHTETRADKEKGQNKPSSAADSHSRPPLRVLDNPCPTRLRKKLIEQFEFAFVREIDRVWSQETVSSKDVNTFIEAASSELQRLLVNNHGIGSEEPVNSVLLKEDIHIHSLTIRPS